MPPIPLTEQLLAKAVHMVNEVFPDDTAAIWNPNKSLLLSLRPQQNTKSDTFVDYWVVLNETEEVIGVTGLYRTERDPSDVVWLGWYCVRADVRRKGLGRALLQWTMETAQNRGFKKMKLYTSTDPNEGAAQILYEKLGFKVVGENEGDGIDRTIFREKVLYS